MKRKQTFHVLRGYYNVACRNQLASCLTSSKMLSALSLSSPLLTATAIQKAIWTFRPTVVLPDSGKRKVPSVSMQGDRSCGLPTTPQQI